MSHHLSPCAVVQSHVQTHNNGMSSPFIDADAEKISDTQAQRILDYCQDESGSCYQSILVTTLLLLSLSLGDDDAFRVMPSTNDGMLPYLSLSVVTDCMQTYPPQDVDALMALTHLHQFVDDNHYSTDTVLSETPAPRSIVPLLQSRGLTAKYPPMKLAHMRYRAMDVVTRCDHHRQRVYGLTYTEITYVLTACEQLFPQSDEEVAMCITVGVFRAQRSDKPHGLLTPGMKQYSPGSLMMRDIYDLLPYNTYDAKRIYRASQDLIPHSTQALTKTPLWSLTYVEYALSQWSLDEALKRIVRAVNLRAPLSCHQFLTLCHEYESIQHVPDVQLIDLWHLSQSPVVVDACDASVYPGDMVVVSGRSGGSTFHQAVVTTVNDDHTLRVFPYTDYPIENNEVIKLTHEHVDHLANGGG